MSYRERSKSPSSYSSSRSKRDRSSSDSSSHSGRSRRARHSRSRSPARRESKDSSGRRLRTPSPRSKKMDLVEKAYRARNDRNWPAVIKYHTRLINEFEEDPRSLLWRARAFELLLNYEMAKEDIYRVQNVISDPVKFSVSDAEHYTARASLQMASVIFQQGKNVRYAVTWVNKSLEYSPDQKRSLVLRARIYRSLNEYKLEAADRKKILEVSPGDLSQREALVEALALDSRFEEAKMECNILSAKQNGNIPAKELYRFISKLQQKKADADSKESRNDQKNAQKKPEENVPVASSALGAPAAGAIPGAQQQAHEPAAEVNSKAEELKDQKQMQPHIIGPLAEASKESVAKLFESHGVSYAQYASEVRVNGVHGQIVLDYLASGELEEMLKYLGVKNPLHKRVLMFTLKSLPEAKPKS